ncbi:hypothetical protein [Microbacterium suwonense]|uniref:Multidrug transporter n=1 Tax=Microbacterium suwonense TaxID=683047 RepID=A0ABM8FQM5_9MICO|nr:hypothetical protein [Microbacterium suwonense]BDZ37983.1 hypothetical protein GCM10025863_05970 [Microbacterium suwonense]
MSNPTPNYLPEDPDAEASTDPATREVNGERVLDPDADPDLIDSAEADRLATGGDDDGDGATRPPHAP